MEQNVDDRFDLVVFAELEFGFRRLLCRFPWRKTLSLPDTEEYKNERKKPREKGAKEKARRNKNSYPRMFRVWKHLAVLNDE